MAAGRIRNTGHASGAGVGSVSATATVFGVPPTDATPATGDRGGGADPAPLLPLVGVLAGLAGWLATGRRTEHARARRR